MARRRRGLSAEERALWERVAQEARPLRPAEARAAAPEPAAPSPAPVASPSPSPRLAVRRPVPPVRPDADPHVALERAQPHMDRRRFERLRRGRLEPEARLDLHGMDAARAHAALSDFVLRAHAGGLRLVLVITGKGRPGAGDGWAGRGGVLRHSVPHWLNAPPLVGRVLQLARAHERHGGAGALYVYLRRSRP